ncbi:MAG: DUF4340 domain-containing protein [Marinicella sp.]|nr:DUF4340 domain-containing protein [Xanthomonadales bacterium]
MLNNFKVLLGLLIIIAGFAYFVTHSDQGSAELSQYLMPEWQVDNQLIGQIDQVSLTQNGEQIILQKNTDGWHVNSGFFANLTPLSALFQSLKSAEFVEAKTRNPENFAQLELADNDLKIALYKGETLLDEIHVGKKTSSGEVFVRRADDNQTYTVKGLTPPTFNQNNWMLSTVVDVPADNVVRVSFEPVEGDGFTIQRDTETLSLQVLDMPETHQLKMVDQLNNLVGGLSRLMIDEALPLDLSDKFLKATNTYQLSDGSEIVLQLYQQDESYFLTVAGEKVSRFEPWMMKIAAYKFEALNKQLTDVIEPKVKESTVPTAETQVENPLE